MISKHVKIISYVLMGVMLISYGIGNGFMIRQEFNIAIKWMAVMIIATVINMSILTYDFLRWRKKNG